MDCENTIHLSICIKGKVNMLNDNDIQCNSGTSIFLCTLIAPTPKRIQPKFSFSSGSGAILDQDFTTGRTSPSLNSDSVHSQEIFPIFSNHFNLNSCANEPRPQNPSPVLAQEKKNSMNDKQILAFFQSSRTQFRMSQSL